MRARFIGAFIAGAALVLSAVVASPAAAVPALWTVTPGGAFTGSAGVTNLAIQESGIALTCKTSTVSGTAKSGTGLSNPIASIPASPGIKFFNCSGPFGLTFTVTQVGTWALNGVSYASGTGITTGTLTNITANIVGPGCNATVTGFVNAKFTNSTDILQVINNYTLLVSFVDSVNDCLGLINTGEHASFAGSYKITPGLTVTSP